MKTKKLLKKIEAHVQDLTSDAYSEGYSDGVQDTHLDTDLAYRNGVEEERNRVIGLFNMLSEQELVNGSGTKAKLYRAAADLVAVANQLEKIDWSEEGIDEAYYEDLDKEGF
jgi:hypothetical protein